MAQKRSKKKDDHEEDDTEVILSTSDMSRIPYDQVRKLMKGEAFDMKLNHTDAKYVVAAVNQGIDSRLQACFSPENGDSYTWRQNKLHCVVSEQSLPVLIRRLYETDQPEAVSLADGILSTLRTHD